MDQTAPHFRKRARQCRRLALVLSDRPTTEELISLAQELETVADAIEATKAVLDRAAVGTGRRR